MRHVRGRPAHPDLANRLPGQRVDQRGLAAAGGPGQRDDGVRGRRAAAAPRPCRRPARPRSTSGGSSRPAAELEHLVERGQPVGEPSRPGAARSPRSRVSGRPRRRPHRGARPHVGPARTARAQPERARGGRGRRTARGPARGTARARRASSSSTRSIRSARAWCRQRPHRAVAEHRLEHLLATADVPPATRTSAPVSPPVWANTASMTARPAPFTPNDASRAAVRRSRPSCAHQLEHAALPGADLALAARGGSRRTACPSPPGASPSSAAPPGAPARPRRCARPRRPPRPAPASPRWTRAPPAPARSAAAGRHERRVTRSRSRPIRASQRAQQLAGADELLPAGQHLAAQQRCRRGRRRRRRAARRVGASGLVAQQGRGGELLVAPRGRAPDTRSAQAAQRAVQGRPDDLGPGVGVARRAASSQSRSGADDLLRAAGASPSSGASGTANSGGPAQAVVGEHLRRGGAPTSRIAVRRHPVAAPRRARCRVAGRCAAGPTARRRRSGRPMVTKIHRSAAASSWAASAGCSATTESTSGASSSASPAGTAGAATSCRRARRRRRRRRRSVRAQARAAPAPSANQRRSAGWQTSTGPRVVGRSTPGRGDRRADQACSPASTCPRRSSRRRRRAAARRGCRSRGSR